MLIVVSTNISATPAAIFPPKPLLEPELFLDDLDVPDELLFDDEFVASFSKLSSSPACAGKIEAYKQRLIIKGRVRIGKVVFRYKKFIVSNLAIL